MTTGIFVTYDTTTLSPTPLVNYVHQPINFGYVYGYNTDISLDGFYTGITTTGTAISYLTGVFANQFKGLTVTDDQSNILYQWTGITVDSINLDTNSYFQGSFVKYSVKLKSFDVPSGVVDPSNEYSFTQNDNGTVNVNHKISARAVRNLTGAFQNAVNFVKQFTGKDPFTNCAPILVPGGSGVILSISENINRADAIYSVNEVYQYRTGSFVPYVRQASLDVTDSIDAEYKEIQYNVKTQGSPINNNLNSIINNNLNYALLSDIQNEFGFSTTNWVKNTYSAEIDSGAATVDIKVGYMSGANPSGFFDYVLTCEQNLLDNTEDWKIDGDFRCFGPLDYKSNQLNAFKAANSGLDWRPYLTGLIISSPVFSGNHNTAVSFSPNCTVQVIENTQLATLRITLVMENGYEPVGFDSLKYSLSVTPSKWVYELLPSATIEGSYVVQDLQTATRPRQKFELEGKSANLSNASMLVSGYLTGLVATYVSLGDQNNTTAFLIDDEVVTGIYDISRSITWLGQDNGIGTGLLSLQAIGTSSFSVPTRPAGYNFGY